VQRIEAVLEQQPLLWVHHSTFGRRDAKANVVKQLGSCEEATVLHGWGTSSQG
jgi:hypothetical protein